MKGQAGFWDIEHRLAELSAEGDPLEKLSDTVDFEIFRPVLAKALRRSDPAKGGRPGFDVVLKFKMLVLQSLRPVVAAGLLSGSRPAELDAFLRS